MFGAIKYNLANLTNFSGRDARQTFWYYVLFLVVVQILVGIVAAIPMYIEMFTSAFESARNGVDESAMNAAMFGSISGMMRSQMYVSAIIGVVTAFLFAAAFVRRLHDSGKPGWFVLFALVPVLGTTFYNLANIDNIVAMTEQAMAATDPQEALGTQTQLYLNSILGWIGYLVVIIFGVMKSDPNPNKYGDVPESF